MKEKNQNFKKLIKSKKRGEGLQKSLINKKNKYFNNVILILIGVFISNIFICTGGYFYINSIKKEVLKQEIIDDDLISIYLEDENGEYVTTENNFFPTSGYVFDKSLSYCVNESDIDYNYETNSLKYNFDGSDKCYVYFSKGTLLSEKILMNENESITNIEDAKEYIQQKAPVDFNTVSKSDDGIYVTDDNDGRSYYFRGAVEDNYLEFANIIWRIIRIDGSGNIKLIYEKSNHLAIPVQKYTDNRSFYFYESAAKTYLEGFYSANLEEDYKKYMVPTNYCVDTKAYNYDDTILFNGYDRLQTNKNPTLLCDDLYETNLFVGTISVDEMAFAGARFGTSNKAFYLYKPNSGNIWSITPCSYTTGTTMFFINGDGTLHYVTVARQEMVIILPTISLISSSRYLSGDGTEENPYKIVE